jgi:uncharacterized membrane protein
MTKGKEGFFARGIAKVKSALTRLLMVIVKPIAKVAGKYAMRKAPEFIKSKIGDSLSGIAENVPTSDLIKGATAVAKEKSSGAVSKVASAIPGVGGGGGDGEESKKDDKQPTGTGRGRRLPLQHSVDVAAPIDTVYNQWTQFEKFPDFMRQVKRIEQQDDTHLTWHERMWFISKTWQAEILEQRPDERIMWRSTDGPKQLGVISFVKLAENLTRVEVSLDFQPKGLTERIASGLRVARRALRADLRRFKALMEMTEDETGAWRGEIEDAEVNGSGSEEEKESSPEEAEMEEQSAEDQTAEDSEEESDSDSEEESDEEESDEEESDEDEVKAEDEEESDEDSEEEDEKVVDVRDKPKSDKPKKGQRAKSRDKASSGKGR